jgi:hypothetical protein
MIWSRRHFTSVTQSISPCRVPQAAPDQIQIAFSPPSGRYFWRRTGSVLVRIPCFSRLVHIQTYVYNIWLFSIYILKCFTLHSIITIYTRSPPVQGLCSRNLPNCCYSNTETYERSFSWLAPIHNASRGSNRRYESLKRKQQYIVLYGSSDRCIKPDDGLIIKGRNM